MSRSITAHSAAHRQLGFFKLDLTSASTRLHYPIIESLLITGVPCALMEFWKYALISALAAWKHSGPNWRVALY